jgi:thiol-disulfide isomerase/thioredoxin
MRMKKIALILSLILSFSSFSQQPIRVTVSGNIFNSPVDSVDLAQNFGSYYKSYSKVKLSKKGDFTINAELPNSDYYVFRIGGSNINLILRDGSDIKIYGDGSNIFNFCNIVGSEESDRMNGYVKTLSAWYAKRDSLVKEMQAHPERQEEINKSASNDYYNFQAATQSFIAQNQNSAALVPVISTLDPENDFATYETIINQLNIGFSISPTIQQLTANYRQLKTQREAANALAPGKLAPDFEELKVDGINTMKLSDLRGKVVLLDFWASWCGPCRKENPNVVKLYEQYEKDGFTVMSVSLDRDKNAWIAAIEKDNLKWPNHVSDLQQWSSKVGQQYQVKGIPFTVLLDREGKIIKTNLRGEALEAELKSIFGR